MDMEAVAFEIITCVGSAKSSFIEAIQRAKQGKFEQAAACIKQGDAHFAEGHHAHADLIAQEADGQPVNLCLLLMHAEDQLMSAETARIYALEFIELYQKLHADRP